METTKATAMPRIRVNASVCVKWQAELYQLHGRGSQHGGHRQIESILRRQGPGHADENPAHNRCSGAGGSGYNSQHLKNTDEQSVPPGDLLIFLILGVLRLL